MMRLLGLSPVEIATPEMRGLFSDRATLQSMLDVEAGLARAAARCGIVTVDDAAVVDVACDAGRYDTDTLAAGALRAGTPTIPLVRALTRGGPSPSTRAAVAAVHVGATSQDVADTALVLQLRRAMDLLRAAGGTAARRILRAMAAAHAATPMLGRTLLQPGPPITFGLKVAGWEAALQPRLRADGREPRTRRSCCNTAAQWARSRRWRAGDPTCRGRWASALGLIGARRAVACAPRPAGRPRRRGRHPGRVAGARWRAT